MLVIRGFEEAAIAARARAGEDISQGQLIHLLRMLDGIGLIKVDPEAPPEPQAAAASEPEAQAPQPEIAPAAACAGCCFCSRVCRPWYHRRSFCRAGAAVGDDRRHQDRAHRSRLVVRSS
jgi:hypothetical protein